MKKILMFLTAFFIFGISNVDAAIYKGQKVFAKECKKCHDNSLELVVSKTTEEWNEILDDNGTKLLNIHLKNDDLTDSIDYFKSKKYNKQINDLKDFLKEYSKDSGNIPTCN